MKTIFNPFTGNFDFVPDASAAVVDWENPGAIGAGTKNSVAATNLSFTGQLSYSPTETPPSNGVIRLQYLLGNLLPIFTGGLSSNFQVSHALSSVVTGIHNTGGALALQWSPITNTGFSRVLIGTGTDNGDDRLQVNGSIRASSFYVLPPQSAPTAPDSGLRLFANSSNNLAWRNPAGNIVTIDAGDLTASRIIKLQNRAGTIAYLDDISAGGGTPSQSNNSYYTYLQSLSDLQVLVGLEDWAGNIVFDRSNNPIGFYSGNFAQQRPSLLSDANARSVLLRTGGILLDGFTVPSGSVGSCTIVLRFQASSDARGVLFSYGNSTDFNPSSYDRVVYLNGNSLSVYGFDMAAVQVVNLDSTLNVRDGQPHTLVVRFSPIGTDLWVDNVKLIDDSRIIKSDYEGYWRIGHGLIFGDRSALGGFARGVNFAGFATFNRLLLAGSELEAVHTNA